MRAYPFQIAQFLANIGMGTGALSGSTTTTTSPAGFFSGFKEGGKVEGYRRGGLIPESAGGHVAPEHMGEGYADGGAPSDYSSMIVQQLFGGMNPNAGAYGQGNAGLGGAGFVPQANLPVGQLMVAEPVQGPKQTNASDIVDMASSLTDTADKAGKMWDKYKPRPEFNVDTKDDSLSGQIYRANGGRTGLATGGGMPYDPQNTGYVPDNSPSKAPELIQPKDPQQQESGLSKVADIAKIIGMFMARGGAADGGYSVVKGDTLSDIARKHGRSLEDILSANPELRKNPDLIQIGQRIMLPQDRQAAGTPFPAQPSTFPARPGLAPSGMPIADRSANDVINSPSFGNEQLFSGNYQSPGLSDNMLALRLQSEAMARRRALEDASMNPGSFASGGVAGRSGYLDGGFASDTALAELARKKREQDILNELGSSQWSGLSAARNDADLEEARRAALLRSQGAGLSVPAEPREFPRQSTPTGLVPAISPSFNPGQQNLPPPSMDGSVGDVTSYGRAQDRPVTVTNPTTNARSTNQYVPEETAPRTLREMLPMVDAANTVFGPAKSEMSPAEAVGRPLIDVAANAFPVIAGLAGQGWDLFTKPPSEYNALYNTETPTAKLHPGLSPAPATAAAPAAAAPVSTTTGFRELNNGVRPGLGTTMRENVTRVGLAKGPMDLTTGEAARELPPAAGAPRNARNNNPGNLVASDWTKKQPGFVGTDGPFAVFDTPENGRRAQAQLLTNYINSGDNTLTKIINRWAPPDAPGNTPESTRNYIAHIAAQTGIDPNQQLTPADVSKILDAQAGFEGGTTGGARTDVTQLGGNDMAAGRAEVANAPQGGLSTGRNTAETAAKPGGVAGGFDLGKMLTDENVVLPFLAGLGKMAGSQSRYLGTALLEGIGGGAEAYMKRQEQLANIAQTQAQTRGQDVLNVRNSIQSTDRGDIVWTSQNGVPVPVLLGAYQGMMNSGQVLPPLGFVPTNATNVLNDYFERIGIPKIETGAPKVGAETEKRGSDLGVSAPTMDILNRDMQTLMTAPSAYRESQKKMSDQIEEGVISAGNNAMQQGNFLNQITHQLMSLPETGVLSGGPLAEVQKNALALYNQAIGLFGEQAAANLRILPEEIGTQYATDKLAAAGVLAQNSSVGAGTVSAIQLAELSIPNKEIPVEGVRKILAGLYVDKTMSLDRWDALNKAKDYVSSVSPAMPENYLAQNIVRDFGAQTASDYANAKLKMERILSNYYTMPDGQKIPVVDLVMQGVMTPAEFDKVYGAGMSRYILNMVR